MNHAMEITEGEVQRLLSDAECVTRRR